MDGYPYAMNMGELKEVIGWAGGVIGSALFGGLLVRMKLHRGSQEIMTDKGKDTLIDDLRIELVTARVENERLVTRAISAELRAGEAWTETRKAWGENQTYITQVAVLTAELKIEREARQQLAAVVQRLEVKIERLTRLLAGIPDTGPAPLE